ncbi:hypothetical protein [Sphaerisporangium album]|nr:hypothetical protein [Sphaerisporangium album]
MNAVVWTTDALNAASDRRRACSGGWAARIRQGKNGLGVELA